MAHDKVPDEVVDRVQKAVLRGMGLIVLHSGHHSKIFRRLMGTTCNLKWRDNTHERIWTIKPNHPIAAGVPETFVLDPEEMYGESFDIPNPEEIIFMGWFDGGEVFRSGCTWTRGHGKIFYFQPGHETNRSFQNEHVQRIITNAVRWACPINKNIPLVCPNAKPVENI
jgi:trehalose utilization protein